jgi:hypothetical protein
MRINQGVGMNCEEKRERLILAIRQIPEPSMEVLEMVVLEIKDQSLSVSFWPGAQIPKSSFQLITEKSISEGSQET